ncbi:fimbrial protein [Photorhabdus luminescens]|nr:fimbrial protein [Photorhabdus luminescens]
MILIGWSIGCVAWSVQANGKNNIEITIKGNLLRPTCALSVNGEHPDILYRRSMPQVYASELRNSKYVERSALDLKFQLSHCSPGQSPALYIWSRDASNSDDSELFMPVDGGTTKGVGIRLLDVSTNQFVKVKPINDPFQMPLPSVGDGTTRTFRAYVGGLGDKNNPATCKSDGTNVLCGGTANVQIHFEFSYEHLK